MQTSGTSLCKYFTKSPRGSYMTLSDVVNGPTATTILKGPSFNSAGSSGKSSHAPFIQKK